MIALWALGYSQATEGLGAQATVVKQNQADSADIDEIIKAADIEAQVLAIEKTIGKKVSTIGKLDFYDRMDRFKTVFSESANTGESVKQFIKRVGDPEIMDKLGLSNKSPHYLETVYRTNHTSAHSAGRWQAAEAFPEPIMLQYVGVQDSRQAAICSQCTGTVAPQDDRFWSVHTPPNHFSCRCTIIEITQSYADLRGIKPVRNVITETPGAGFSTNPGASDDWMKPTKDMTQRLKSYE